MTMTNTNLAMVRRTLAKEIGKDQLASFHDENLFLDLLAVFGVFAFFISMIVALVLLPMGWLWGLCFVAQGFSVQWMALVSHDVFVHRMVGGKNWSWVGSILLTVPRFSMPTGYREAHLAHHRHIGTPLDSERYKQDLNTTWRRLLFATFVGGKMAQAGLFSDSHKNGEEVEHYRKVDTRNEELSRRVQVEKIIQRIFLVGVVVGCFVYPAVFFFAYLLPVLVIAPFANTLRIIIEHGETDPDNPFHLATFYKTGPISRLLFFWDSGDCHLVHHLYPRIPYYRISKALDVMRPSLLERGVVERQSFLWLLEGWFVSNHGHRTLWPQHGKFEKTRSQRLARGAIA